MRIWERALDAYLSGLADSVAKAAGRLRYRQECPACRGWVRVSRESARTARRELACARCGWVASVSEAAWRGRPDITLRGAVEAALERRRRRESRREPVGAVPEKPTPPG